jgi:hypothetical protein
MSALTDAERSELVAKVISLQNHPANITQDVVTITGFFTTRAQFARHILHLQNRAQR